jgi:hypothetical protein
MSVMLSIINVPSRVLLAAMVLLGACAMPRREVTRNADRTPPTVRWLSNDARLAQAAGAESASLIVAEAGAVGDRLTKVIETDEMSCLLVMARASDKVADVDLYAYGEDGTVLAVDDRPDAKPTMLVCPPHPRHIYVTARIAIGQGVVAVGVHRVPMDKARRVRSALRVAEQPATGEAANAMIPDVDGRLLAHHGALKGHWTPIAQSALAVDYRIPTVLGLTVDPGTCVDVLALTRTALSGLELELLDESGRTLGRSVDTERDQWIVACAEDRRNVALQLRPHDGIGTALVLVSRGSLRAGRAIEQALELSGGLALEQLIKIAHREMRAARVEAQPVVARTTLVRGQQQRISSRIESDCARFDVFAGAPSSGVHARVYSADGDLISVNGGAQYLPLVACGRGLVTVVVEALSKGGPLSIEKYPQKLASVVASSRPHAAARLFQKAWHLGLLEGSAGFDSIENITFSDKKKWNRDVTVDIGKCADVFVSLDGDSAGVSLNWMDGDSGQAIDGEEHPDSAHLQLCCGAGSSTCTRHVVAEATGASPRALFATRYRR